MDESMTVSRKLKTNDLQSAAVILDFQHLRVVKASLNDVVLDRDWDRIMSYYHLHYKSTIDQLLIQNGYETSMTEPETNAPDAHEKSDHTD
jgi:hypothetical protein